MTQQTATNENQQANGQQNANDNGGTPETWDAYLAAQPEAQRTVIAALHEKQTASLKNALNEERTQRKDFEKQLRDAAAKLEKGSDIEKQVNQLADQLSTESRRADFYEAAVKPEIGLTDAKAAWVLMNADAERYFDRKGNPNFALLKEAHPGLFGQVKPAPKGNQGNGTNSSAAGTSSINDDIRRAAGYTR